MQANHPDNFGDLVPTEWGQALTILTSRPITFTVPWVPAQPEKRWIFYCVKNWEIALHWLIKLEWDSKHKIPCKRRLAKVLKPQGEFLHRLFLLCEKCHSHQALLGRSPYLSACHWFALIYRELLLEGVYDVLLKPPVSVPAASADKKRGVLRTLAETCSMAKQLENPFEGDPLKSANSDILEVAIKLAEGSNLFNKRYYQTFIKSWRDMLSALDTSDFARHFIEGEKLFQVSGRGRGKLTL